MLPHHRFPFVYTDARFLVYEKHYILSIPQLTYPVDGKGRRTAADRLRKGESFPIKDAETRAYKWSLPAQEREREKRKI